MINKILKAVILTLVLNAVALSGWLWVYYKIDNLGSRMGNLQGEILSVDAKQKNIKSLDQTLKSIEDKKSDIERVFVNEKDIIRFIEDLEEVALLSGSSLEISSASLPTRDEGGGPSFILNLRGGFGRLLKFLTLLENMKYQIRIEAAKFDVLENRLWSSQIRLRLLSYQF